MSTAHLAVWKLKLFLSILAWMISSNSCLWSEEDLLFTFLVFKQVSCWLIKLFSLINKFGMVYFGLGGRWCFFGLLLGHLYCGCCSSSASSSSQSEILLQISDSSEYSSASSSWWQHWCRLSFRFFFRCWFKVTSCFVCFSSLFSFWLLITVALTCLRWSGETVSFTLIVLLP